MKLKVLGLIAFSAIAIATIAQVFNPPQVTWSAPIATSVAQCQVPNAHSASVCPVELTAGVISYFFYNGTSFQPLASGATGPQGPAGPTGATGPAGPAGPVQSFVAAQCTTSNVGNAGLNVSGCKEQ